MSNLESLPQSFRKVSLTFREKLVQPVLEKTAHHVLYFHILVATEKNVEDTFSKIRVQRKSMYNKFIIKSTHNRHSVDNGVQFSQYGINLSDAILEYGR